MSETVERVLMNTETGELGLGIAVRFFEKYHSENLGTLEGYKITVEPSDPDGWLVLSGDYESNGPWIFVSQDLVRDKTEILGPL